MDDEYLGRAVFGDAGAPLLPGRESYQGLYAGQIHDLATKETTLYGSNDWATKA
jgi:hypothetical protein